MSKPGKVQAAYNRQQKEVRRLKIKMEEKEIAEVLWHFPYLALQPVSTSITKAEVGRLFEEAQSLGDFSISITSNQTQDRHWKFGNTDPDFDNLYIRHLED